MYGNQYINHPLSMNKYLPVAVLYFFFNSFMLPHGLLYTTLLTPVFFIWLLRYPSLHYIIYFFGFTIPFAVVHYIQGVHTMYYLRSYTLLLSWFIFGIAFYQFLKNCHTLRSIFRMIVLLNFVFVIIACIAYFTSLRHHFWMIGFVSQMLDKFPRLMMLTYEPSYYSTLLVPFAMYYYLKMIMRQLPNWQLFLVLVTVPLVLAFSLGILLGIPLALAILLLYRLPILVRKRRYRYILFGAAALLVLGIVFVFIFFPDNPLFVRLANLFKNRDSSFRGRTVEAYYLASKVAEQKSMVFGAGLGQAKLLGLELWRKFYHFNFSIDQVAIPCVMAETLAAFGIVGVILRLGIEIFLFFKTRVYNNYYRFALFVFIFIYQFTGSYLNNIAELAIWVLAFTNTFEEFDRPKKMKGAHGQAAGFNNNNSI
jgi:hypothetical protein